MKRHGPLSVRFSEDELKVVQDAAQAAGMTISAFMRDAVMNPRYRDAREALLARPGARLIKSWNGAEIVFWTNAPELVSVS